MPILGKRVLFCGLKSIIFMRASKVEKSDSRSCCFSAFSSLKKTILRKLILSFLYLNRGHSMQITIALPPPNETSDYRFLLVSHDKKKRKKDALLTSE